MLLTEIGKTLLPKSGSPLVLSPLQIEARVIAKRKHIEETRRRALTTGETLDTKGSNYLFAFSNFEQR